MTASDVQAASRALPRDAETLMALLVAVDCYAADLYRKTLDADIGAVSDAITDAIAAYEAATEPEPELSERQAREERRDWDAGMDSYREAA